MHLKMLLLLHLREDLLQIWFEAIPESKESELMERFLITILLQKILSVEVEISKVDTFQTWNFPK